jgi:peptidoglycan/xylan/chitin deacetylase (PgdA/CDA1 family)
MAPIRDLGHAVLLSFDNLGEAADLERDPSPPSAPAGDHASVTVALPAVLELLGALDLTASFFVEGINAQLYPDALRAIAGAGHEIGLHAWRHEQWEELSPAEEEDRLTRGTAAFAALGVDVDGFRPPGGGLRPTSLPALAAHGVRWCSPLGTRAGREAGVACLPFRWPLVDAYHRLDSFADLRRALGDEPAPASVAATADALLAGIEAPFDGPLVLILHPFLLVTEAERAQAERVLRRLAEQVATGERWVATGRELAAALPEDAGPPALGLPETARR